MAVDVATLTADTSVSLLGTAVAVVTVVAVVNTAPGVWEVIAVLSGGHGENPDVATDIGAVVGETTVAMGAIINVGVSAGASVGL